MELETAVEVREWAVVDSWGQAHFKMEAGYEFIEAEDAEKEAARMDVAYPDYAPHSVFTRIVPPWTLWE